MTSWSTDRFDLVVVGAGIVGLGHAVAAQARGARVLVLDRNDRAAGASVRNFGHCCVTEQAGEALEYALATRTIWLRLAKETGFWLRDSGTVVVARSAAETDVLTALRADRGDDVVLLTADDVRDRVGVLDDTVVGGAWMPLDLRVDPRAAAPAIADWLEQQGVRFAWSTSMLGLDDDGPVRTSRGPVRADRVVVAVGHDVDRLYPDIAAAHGLQRCSLHMMQVGNPVARVIDPAVLTGWSMLRYAAFAVGPALERVRGELTAASADGVAADMNLMFTQRPDGDIVLGDTHDYSTGAVEPFRAEQRDDLLLDQARRLFATERIDVRKRWRGVYASAPTPFMIAAPDPRLRVVSVTSGIGMTTGLGLAQHVVDEFLD